MYNKGYIVLIIAVKRFRATNCYNLKQSTATSCRFNSFNRFKLSPYNIFTCSKLYLLTDIGAV